MDKQIFSPYSTPQEHTNESVGQDLLPNECGKGLRFANYMIDRLCVFGLSWLAGQLLGYLFIYLPASSYEVIYIYSFAIGISLGFMYFFVLEAFTGRTLGKILTGTKVINVHGQKPSFGQVVGRTFSRYIPFEPFSFLFGDRGWHDSLSKTYVVLANDPMRERLEGFDF